MDRLVTLYHGGSVVTDDYGNVQFSGMEMVPLIFMARPSFSELVARSREELHCGANEDVAVEGLLHFGSKDTILRRMISIGCEDLWEKYVTVVMSNNIKCLDLFVQKVSIDPTAHGYSQELGNPAPFDPPVPNLEVNVEDVPELPDALSASNNVQISQLVQVRCQTDDVVAVPQEIPLTKNHHGDILANVSGQPVTPFINVEEVCRASNSVDAQIMNDVEPYGTARAIDSDDDRPVGQLTESDNRMLRKFFLDHDKAWSKWRGDELLNIFEPGPSMIIQKGLEFGSLPALKISLQEYSLRHNRPLKEKHSAGELQYTVVCEREPCDWRVCARKQKNTRKFKITKIIGSHTCRSAQLTEKQLTSTLIGTSLSYILSGVERPNLRVRGIIEIVEKEWKYKIKYGKAWRAKQHAWKMMYGDWEEGYEQLPALLNAIKATNPGMHYEYVPKPNAWKDGRQIFFRAFWCFSPCIEAFRHCRPVFSIDGTSLLGKYVGTLLIAIGVDGDNVLVPLAFALVEKDNKDSWRWFLRLIRIHVIGPEREVCVISDRHSGILSAIQEQIPGHAPLHHCWCTRHLAENLLLKDGTKGNFHLFEEVARMLEVKNFDKKLEQLKTTTNAEGRDWLRGLMLDVDKWTMAHDAGGWRYEFQTTNMVECLNGLLRGIRDMPVNAIVSFTFYKLVSLFNDRYEAAMLQHSKREKWAPKPHRVLEHEKAKATMHKVECLDHNTGTYEVAERDGTMVDGELWPTIRHKVVLTEFSCTCCMLKQFHFPCSHYVAASTHHKFDYESKIPREFSVENLILTWIPTFEPYLDEVSWPPYSGPRYIADPACHWNNHGTGKRSRPNMVTDQVPGKARQSRATPFLAGPEKNKCGKCGILGHTSRTCHLQPSQDGTILPARSLLPLEAPSMDHLGGQDVAPSLTSNPDGFQAM